MPDIVAIRISIEGRVQEGGLKATARALATEHGVVCDFALDTQGKVSLTAQGERKAVKAFVDALRKASGDTATSFSTLWTGPSGR